MLFKFHIFKAFKFSIINPMFHFSINTTSIFFWFTFLISSVCHAAPPSDKDLQRFLNAYPVGDLFEAGFRASIQLAGSKSIASQEKATCALEKFDKAVIEKAALTEARIHFKDISVLRAITTTLETTAGRKLIASLLRIAPGSDQAPVIPDAGYTPSEEADLRKFQSTLEFAAFQNFAQTAGPRVEEDSAYLIMMSGIKAACLK